MKTITLDTLVKQMKDDASSDRGCGLYFLVLFGLILFGGGLMVHPILSLIVLGCFGMGAWSLLGNSRRTRKNLKNYSFYLTTGVCQSKQIVPGGDEGDSYILTFTDNYSHTINHGDMSLCSSELRQSDEWLYSNTEPGDGFYLVYMQGQTKATYIIPQRFCSLNTADFVSEGGCLRPRKPM